MRPASPRTSPRHADHRCGTIVIRRWRKGRKSSRTGSRCRYNFVWYRPADETEIRAAADSILAPQFAEVIARTAHPFFQPIYDLESPSLVFGRVALFGDSAFGSKIIAHARHLGAYMQAQLLTGP